VSWQNCLLVMQVAEPGNAANNSTSTAMEAIVAIAIM
jgi:hypothetical protein